VSERPGDRTANLPEATAQVAQEHDTRDAAVEPPAASAFPYFMACSVVRAAAVHPFERSGTDPIYRPLRIFSLDPSQSKLHGAVAIVNVPYEPLLPGPVGRLFEVVNQDRARNLRYARVDLDEQKTLILNGRDPSPSDPQFHQQMVYAVCMSVYAAFKAALGRNIAWGFEPQQASPGAAASDAAKSPLRLRLVPHAMREKNACYMREAGEIRFGYYRAGEEIDAKNPPGGYIFTCLSHDVIAHELTHALLDGLREQFLIPTRPDVLAFHEAFGDLVAIFQHFAYKDIVAGAIHAVGADLQRARVLGDLAKQFGYTSGGGKERQALRTAVDVSSPDDVPKQYKPDMEIHELGAVLVSAVFEAFVTLFRRKTERYVRLATNGSGVLPPGTLPIDLREVLADEASQLASQILRVCIRAVDYCPPVDLEFGDYLRAIITADSELVPDDPWAYREALVTAFGRRGIYPSGVRNLAEDSLRWRPPWRAIDIPNLHYKKLQFSGDPAIAPDPQELGRQAEALGCVVTDERYFEAFGLAKTDGQEYMPPCIQSIRTARRVGPNGQVLFDLVAEVIQERHVTLANDTPGIFYGGATVIVDPEGSVRYAIVKNVRNEQRLDEYRRYLGGSGRTFWAAKAGGRLAPREQLFQLVHGVDGVTTESVSKLPDPLPAR
jgi:hypothetical protein